MLSSSSILEQALIETNSVNIAGSQRLVRDKMRTRLPKVEVRITFEDFSLLLLLFIVFVSMASTPTEMNTPSKVKNAIHRAISWSPFSVRLLTTANSTKRVTPHSLRCLTSTTTTKGKAVTPSRAVTMTILTDSVVSLNLTIIMKPSMCA